MLGMVSGAGVPRWRVVLSCIFSLFSLHRRFASLLSQSWTRASRSTPISTPSVLHFVFPSESTRDVFEEQVSNWAPSCSIMRNWHCPREPSSRRHERTGSIEVVLSTLDPTPLIGKITSAQLGQHGTSDEMSGSTTTSLYTRGRTYRLLPVCLTRPLDPLPACSSTSYALQQRLPLLGPWVGLSQGTTGTNEHKVSVKACLS